MFGDVNTCSKSLDTRHFIEFCKNEECDKKPSVYIKDMDSGV